MKQSKSPLHFQMGGYTPTQLTEASFVPTYVGTPLEDAQKYGTDQLNTYKQNIADLTKLDIANSQRKVNPKDAAESAKYDAELKAQFEEMARKGDYENMTHQVNELARRHFNNKDIKLMAENYAEGEKAMQHAQALRDRGLEPLFFNDPNQHQTVTYDEKGNKQLNKYTYTGEAPLDYQEKKAKIWSVIQPDLTPLTESPAEVSKVLAALPGYLATGEWKGITGGQDGKIARLLDDALTSYKQTAEYRQEVRKELAENPGISKEEIEKTISERVLAEGMLKTFSQKGVQLYQDWIQKKAMEDGGDPSSPFVPTLETGATMHDIPGTITSTDFSLFDPTVEHAKNAGAIPLINYMSPKDRAKIQATDPQQRGTPAQREAYETMAKAAIEAKDPEKLKSFYGGDAAEDIKKEKDYLYSPEVFNMVKERKAQIDKDLFYATVSKFDTTPKGQALRKAATDDLKNDIHRKVFYDFATKKIFSMEDQGQANPVFQELIPDIDKLNVTGHTMGINPYGKIANDPRFYNSSIVTYYDAENKKWRKLLAADSMYETDPVQASLSDLWATGTAQPYQVVNYPLNTGGEHPHDIEFKNEGNKGIKVYSVDGHKYSEPHVLSPGQQGFKELYNEVSKLDQ